LLVEPVVEIAVSLEVFVWNAVVVSNTVDVANVVLNAVVVSNTEVVDLLVPVRAEVSKVEPVA
jgi:hypothetical protein